MQDKLYKKLLFFSLIIPSILFIEFNFTLLQLVYCQNFVDLKYLSLPHRQLTSRQYHYN
jgi:hypothetical protein